MPRLTVGSIGVDLLTLLGEVSVGVAESEVLVVGGGDLTKSDFNVSFSNGADPAGIVRGYVDVVETPFLAEGWVTWIYVKTRC